MKAQFMLSAPLRGMTFDKIKSVGALVGLAYACAKEDESKALSGDGSELAANPISGML